MIDLRDFSSHPILLAVLCTFSAWISLCLIARLWLTHRTEPLLRKLIWSLALLIPLFGWLFYADFFRVPERQDNTASDSLGINTDGSL
jgi:hypothetical protein